MEIGDTEKGCKKTCCAIEVRENKAIYYKVRCAALFQDCKVCRITEYICKGNLGLLKFITRPLLEEICVSCIGNGVRTIGRQALATRRLGGEKNAE